MGCLHFRSRIPRLKDVKDRVYTRKEYFSRAEIDVIHDILYFMSIEVIASSFALSQKVELVKLSWPPQTWINLYWIKNNIDTKKTTATYEKGKGATRKMRAVPWYLPSHVYTYIHKYRVQGTSNHTDIRSYIFVFSCFPGCCTFHLVNTWGDYPLLNEISI